MAIFRVSQYPFHSELRKSFATARLLHPRQKSKLDWKQFALTSWLVQRIPRLPHTALITTTSESGVESEASPG